MRVPLIAALSAFGLTAAVTPSNVAFEPRGAPAPGTLVEHKWSTPPLNSHGAIDLASLRGRPTLVDFWGTHCPPCVGGAVPGSIKLKAEFGDDLNVIFVESQGTPPEETEAFIYRHKWGGSEAWWTQEPPCGMDGNGLPAFVLIGSDGRAITAGYPEEQKIREFVEADLKASRATPKGMAPALAAALKDYNKGNFANAIQAANKVAADASSPDAANAQKLAAEWTTAAQSRVERLAYMVEHAHLAKADAEVLSLRTGLKGLPELEAKLADLAGKLAADGLKPEREAARALTNVMDKVNEKGLEDKTPKDLRRIAEKYSGTQSAERAAHLAKLFEMKVSKDSL